METEKLNKILSDHKLWFENNQSGIRADLQGADLQEAKLKWANLKGAILEGAILEGANLEGANLEGDKLKWANLQEAKLKWANLQWANLKGADLEGANLEGADLKGADLEGANLAKIKENFLLILETAKPEIEFLKSALENGKVNGSVYTGECACLIGTIANARKCDVNTLEKNLYSPAERWFLGIKPRDIAESNQIVKITLDWIEEFQNQ